MSSRPSMMSESSSNQGDFNDFDSSEEEQDISKPGENPQKDDESVEMSSRPPMMGESSSNQGDFNDLDSSEENKSLSKPGENQQKDDESDEMSSLLLLRQDPEKPTQSIKVEIEQSSMRRLTRPFG
ncbi:hypothetical protein ACOME3_010466 [Neoechinorhynchus agilis]